MKLTEKNLCAKGLISLSDSLLLTRVKAAHEFYCVGQSSSAIIPKHHWHAAVSSGENSIPNAMIKHRF